MLIKVPNVPKSYSLVKNTLVECWSIAIWVVKIRPEKASKTWVLGPCAHNRKCTLPVRLERVSNTNEVAICEYQNHFVSKRVMRRQEK